MNHDHATFPANHESVTFVGRPFPLDEAHEHFSRLRRWGFTFSKCNEYRSLFATKYKSSQVYGHLGGSGT